MLRAQIQQISTRTYNYLVVRTQAIVHRQWKQTSEWEKFLHFDFPGLFIPLSIKVIDFFLTEWMPQAKHIKSAFRLDLVLLLRLVILRLRVRFLKIEDIRMTKFKFILQIRRDNRWVEISILHPLPFTRYPLPLQKYCRFS